MYVPQDTVELGGKFQQRRFSRLKHYDSRFGRNEERSVKALQDYRRYTPIPALATALDILYDWGDNFAKGPKSNEVIDDHYDFIAIMTLVSNALDEEPRGVEDTMKALELQVAESDRAFEMEKAYYKELENATYKSN